jgi:hypothetical protein
LIYYKQRYKNIGRYPGAVSQRYLNEKHRTLQKSKDLIIR